MVFVCCSSAALAPSTFHQMEEEFGVPVVEVRLGAALLQVSLHRPQTESSLTPILASPDQAYAMTEAAHQMTSNNLPPGQRKPGSVGQGQGGCMLASLSTDSCSAAC
jgi:hypothetical protein